MPSIRRVSSCPARPTNGSPWRSSCSPGSLADEHQVCVRVADAEHDVRASLRERALRARERVALEVVPRVQPVDGADAVMVPLAPVKLADGVPHRSGRHLGGEHPEPVEVHARPCPSTRPPRRRRRGGCATDGSRGPSRGARSPRAAGSRPSCIGRWWRRPRASCWLRGEGIGLGEGLRVGRARAREHPTRVVDDVSHRVHDRQRRDRGGVDPGDRVPDTARHRAVGAAPLADRRTATRADPPTEPIARRGGLGGAPSLGRTRRWIGADEVVDGGCGHDRHRSEPGGEPETLLGEPRDDTVGRGEPERRASREHDRVDLVDGATGLEDRDLAGRRRAAAHLGRAGGAGWAEHHGDARRLTGPVSDTYAGHRVEPDRAACAHGVGGDGPPSDAWPEVGGSGIERAARRLRSTIAASAHPSATTTHTVLTVPTPVPP